MPWINERREEATSRRFFLLVTAGLLSEIALVFVRLYHIAGFIVNADHHIM